VVHLRIWIWEVMRGGDQPPATSDQAQGKRKRRERLYHRGHGGATELAEMAGRGWSFCGRRGEFAVFGFFPEGFELGAGDFGEGGALFAGNAFHFAEAAGKFGAGFFHGEFGIDVEEAREIDGDEENVAKFGFDAVGGFFFAEGFAEFVGFFAEFVEDTFDVFPVEADAGGFAGELEALEEGGKGGNYAV
jgi:hypothetical protein